MLAWWLWPSHNAQGLGQSQSASQPRLGAERSPRPEMKSAAGGDDREIGSGRGPQAFDHQIIKPIIEKR
jgi:hypothetical protein